MQILKQNSLPKGFNAFLVTETLGAFNDNLFKMLLQLFVLQYLKAPNAESLIATSSLVFTLPFMIFGPWSGYFSDRYSKTGVMRVVKLAEIPFMLLGVYGFYVSNTHLLMLSLFLTATQSAFFAPSKSGYIPETCTVQNLTRANSLVSMTTFFAIIFGIAAAGQVFNMHAAKPYIASFYCMAVAVFGVIAVYSIPMIPASGRRDPFPLNPVRGIWKDIAFIKSNKGLFLATLAHSYFWLLGLVFTTNILVYGKKILHLSETDNTMLSLLPAIMGIGIAMGSLLAGRWSGKKIELGLVPLGGLGLAAAGVALYFSQSYLLTSTILMLSGICGGLFIVPLFAYIQFTAPQDEKGRVLSTVGVINGFFLVLGSLLYRLMSVDLSWQPHTIYLVMGILSFFVVIYICTVIPEYFLRFLSWLMIHTFYRIKIKGAENVPLEGPVLLTPNHISYVDALLIGATIQRFIKFIMYKKIYELPLIRQLCRIMEVIPIAPYEGRESVMKSLEMGKEKLAQGEALCIFPEGKITRDGQISEFRTGLETLMKERDCPIVPVYLHNVWGSIFSFEDGKAIWKWPKKIPYPITVVFGEALSPKTPAAEVEAAVRKLALEFEGKKENT